MKRIIKQVLFSLISVFLAYRAFELLRSLWASGPSDLNPLGTFIIAFLLNLFITGVVAIPGFAMPTHKLIGDSYFSIKNPTRLKQIYQLLKVGLFRKALMIFFWGKKKNRAKYFDGKRSGIENFIYQTKQSEFGHLIPFLLILISTIILLFKGYWLLFLISNLINFIGNFYPIILQRHHRMRIERLAKRLERSIN